MRIEDLFYLTMILFVAYFFFDTFVRSGGEGLQNIKFKECSQKAINEQYNDYIFGVPKKFVRPE